MTGGRLRGWPVRERKERKRKRECNRWGERERSRSKGKVNRTSPSEGLWRLIGSDSSK